MKTLNLKKSAKSPVLLILLLATSAAALAQTTGSGPYVLQSGPTIISPTVSGSIKLSGVSTVVVPSGDTTGATDVSNIQAAVNAAAGQTGNVTLSAGTFYLNAPINLASAVILTGSGDPGYGFQTQVTAINSQVFSANNVHEVIVENLTIYTTGSSPPANLIYTNNSYEIQYKNIGVYVSNQASSPTSEVVLQDSSISNGITYDTIRIRTVGGTTTINYGFHFKSGSGTARVVNSDIENAYRLVQWEGGNITVESPYTGSTVVYALYCNPVSDSTASMTWIGGQAYAPPSGSSIGIDAGTKNLRVINTYVSGSNNSDVNVVSTSGLSNIYFDYFPINLARVTTSDIGYLKFPDTAVYAGGNTGATPQSIAGVKQTWTQNSSVTWASPTTAGYVGQTLTLLVQHDSTTNSYATAWNSAYRNAPTVAASATANSKATFNFMWDGTHWQFIGGSTAFQ